VNGLPGLSKIPVLGRLFSNETTQGESTEIIILLTPHIVKMPNIADRNLRGLMVGTSNDLRYRGLPVSAGEVLAARLEDPPTDPEPAALRIDAGTGVASELLRMEHEEGILRLRMTAENMAGADLVIEFDPAAVTIRSVVEGGLLSKDGSAVTLIESLDRERGELRVSLNRPSGAPGISGEGAILELQVAGLGPDGAGLRVGELRMRTSGAPPVEAARVITDP